MHQADQFARPKLVVPPPCRPRGNRLGLKLGRIKPEYRVDMNQRGAMFNDPTLEIGDNA